MKIHQHTKWRKGFPYYKVQYYDYKNRAWHDIQKRFNTEAEARHHGITIGVKYRVMEIHRDRRHPV